LRDPTTAAGRGRCGSRPPPSQPSQMHPQGATVGRPIHRYHSARPLVPVTGVLIREGHRNAGTRARAHAQSEGRPCTTIHSMLPLPVDFYARRVRGRATPCKAPAAPLGWPPNGPVHAAAYAAAAQAAQCAPMADTGKQGTGKKQQGNGDGIGELTWSGLIGVRRTAPGDSSGELASCCRPCRRPQWATAIALICGRGDQ